MDKIDKIISIIHSLKEQGMGVGAVSSGPTNTTNPPGQINIAGLPPDMPPVMKGKKGKKYATGGRGSRKWWLQSLKGK